MSRFDQFEERPDLTERYKLRGVLEVKYAPAFGVAIRRQTGWFVSNDTRWDRVGVRHNTDLVWPTVGPYPSFEEAVDNYERAMGLKTS